MDAAPAFLAFVFHFRLRDCRELMLVTDLLDISSDLRIRLELGPGFVNDDIRYKLKYINAQEELTDGSLLSDGVDNRSDFMLFDLVREPKISLLADEACREERFLCINLVIVTKSLIMEGVLPFHWWMHVSPSCFLNFSIPIAGVILVATMPSQLLLICLFFFRRSKIMR